MLCRLYNCTFVFKTSSLEQYSWPCQFAMKSCLPPPFKCTARGSDKNKINKRNSETSLRNFVEKYHRKLLSFYKSTNFRDIFFAKFLRINSRCRSYHFLKGYSETLTFFTSSLRNFVEKYHRKLLNFYKSTNFRDIFSRNFWGLTPNVGVITF